MRKWILAVAAAVLLCSACSRKSETAGEKTPAVETEAQASGKVEALLKEGKQYIKDENYEMAVETYEACIALDEKNTTAYRQLSSAYMGMEEFDMAIEALERGVAATGDAKLTEEWKSCIASVTDIYMEQEDYEAAIPWLLKQKEFDKENPKIYLSLGEAYSMMDMYKEAVEALSEGNQEDSQIKEAAVSAKLLYGEQCYEEGETETAVALLKEVMEAAPEKSSPYALLILAYTDAGRAQEAEPYVRAGMERFVNAESTITDEELDEFLNAASSYYAETDNMEACLQFWEKAVSLRPGNQGYKDELSGYRSMVADGAYMKGDELLETGDVAGAAQYYKRAFSLASQNYEPGIISNDSGTYCLRGDGSFQLGWYQDEVGGKYYFNPQSGKDYARAVTGWQQLDGAYYYFEEEGLMLVDDVTPDGKQVGPDGKLIEGASEEETEEETDDAGQTEEETGTDTETEKETEGKKPENDGTMVLNEDTLDTIRENGGSVMVKKDELFLNAPEEMTMNDVYDCLKKYGSPEWLSNEAPYEVVTEDLKLWILTGDEWNSTGVVVKDPAKYGEAVRKKTLPEDVQFAVEFK